MNRMNYLSGIELILPISVTIDVKYNLINIILKCWLLGEMVREMGI